MNTFTSSFSLGSFYWKVW